MKDQFDLKKFLIENKLTNSSLREEDEDWDIEVGEEWNVQELGINDYITPEMFQDNKYGNEFKALNQDFKIVRFKVNNTTLPNGDINTIYYFDIEYKDRFGKTQQQNYQVKSFNNNFLKPQYQIVPPNDLNEQNNDWEFDVSDNWNVTELNTGDFVTMDMVEPGSKLAKIFNNIRDKKVEIVGISHGEFGWVLFAYGAQVGELSIDSFKNSLKPNYKLAFRLNEQDEDWEFNVSDRWNEIELTVGDEITPEMWDKKAVIDAGEEDEFLNGETWTIDDIGNGGWINITSNGGGNIGWSIDDVQALLKLQYKIVEDKDLFEQDDSEWEFDVSDNWNVKELGVGDKINLDMFEHIWGEWFLENKEDLEIVNIDKNTNQLQLYWFNPIKQAYQSVWMDIKKFNEELKPQYQVVPPDDLNEQEDDEWEFDVSYNWDIKELGIGDEITPEMWDRKEVIDAGEEDKSWNKEDWIIRYIGNGYVEIESDELGLYFWWIDDVHALLKPEYKIVTP